MNDALALLAVATALRVFLPDLRAGTRRLLRAAVQVGVGELVHTRSADAAGTSTSVASHDLET